MRDVFKDPMVDVFKSARPGIGGNAGVSAKAHFAAKAIIDSLHDIVQPCVFRPVTDLIIKMESLRFVRT
jgi:hypothetical protein